MEKYKELFVTGKFVSPSPKVIKSWLSEYCLTAREFENLLGITHRRFLRYIKEVDNKEHIDMEYAHVRFFLIWAKLVDPEFVDPEKIERLKSKNFFFAFNLKLKEMNLNIEVFSKDFLGFSRIRFYQLKQDNPEKLKKLIRSKIDI